MAVLCRQIDAACYELRRKTSVSSIVADEAYSRFIHSEGVRGYHTFDLLEQKQIGYQKRT